MTTMELRLIRAVLIGLLVALIITAFALARSDASGPIEGQWCDYLGARVEVLAQHPMGTDVVGAIMISGTDYARIVPRSDLTGCR